MTPIENRDPGDETPEDDEEPVGNLEGGTVYWYPVRPGGVELEKWEILAMKEKYMALLDEEPVGDLEGGFLEGTFDEDEFEADQSA